MPPREARAFYVSREWFTDTEFQDSTDAATQIGYLGLLMLSDDAGWLKWDPRQIGAFIWVMATPDDRRRRIDDVRRSLVESGRLVIHDCGHAHLPKRRPQPGGGKDLRVSTEHESCVEDPTSSVVDRQRSTSIDSPYPSPSPSPFPSARSLSHYETNAAHVRAREGIHNLDDAIVAICQELTGRSITTLHGGAEVELDRLCEVHGGEDVQRALRLTARKIANGKPPSWQQLVFGARNELEPIPGRMTGAERTEAERDEAREWVRRKLER